MRTLADFLTHHWRIVVYCRNQDCRHSARADLQALADRLGPGRDLYARPVRWRCSRCGSSAEIRISAPPSDWQARQRAASSDEKPLDEPDGMS